MDIHKPKPFHGWREFLKEYGIIVVGVLTALALEQAVELLHWREQVRAAEDALLPEIRLNLLNSYERIAQQPCFDLRTAELRDRLLAPGLRWTGDPDPMQHAPAGPRPNLQEVATSFWSTGMPNVLVTPSRPWPQGAYQAALASGALNHMPRDRAATYARLNNQSQEIKAWEAAEHAAKVRLAPLAFDTTLTPEERHQYLSALGEVAYFQGSIDTAAAQLIRTADKAGFRMLRGDLGARESTWLHSPRKDCLYLPAVPLDPS